MEQDWSTVRGKKYNAKIINNNLPANNRTVITNMNTNPNANSYLKILEPIILSNINNIVTTEFKQLKPFVSPLLQGEPSDDGELLNIRWNNV